MRDSSGTDIRLASGQEEGGLAGWICHPVETGSRPADVCMRVRVCVHTHTPSEPPCFPCSPLSAAATPDLHHPHQLRLPLPRLFLGKQPCTLLPHPHGCSLNLPPPDLETSLYPDPGFSPPFHCHPGIVLCLFEVSPSSCVSDATCSPPCISGTKEPTFI